MCGQKAAALHLGLHNFLHDATHEFLHLDGKIWRTVKLLVAKPGMLTQEFLAGRRVRYITPLRLYLTFSVLFFALAAIVPQTIIRAGTTQRAGATAAEEAQADRIGKAIAQNLPRTMFVLMPAFGLLTWLFYRRQQPYYIAHLYYSIHFHAFTFLVLSVSMLLGLIPQAGKILGGFGFLATVPYHYIGLRRVFGGSRAVTFAKGTAIAVLYWALVAGAMALMMLLVLRSFGVDV